MVYAYISEVKDVLAAKTSFMCAFRDRAACIINAGARGYFSRQKARGKLQPCLLYAHTKVALPSLLYVCNDIGLA